MSGFQHAFARLGALTASAFVLCFAPAMAWAQDPLPVPKPYESVDANGVDLMSGTMNIPGPSVTVGDPARGGLSDGVSFISTASTKGWRHSALSGISRSGPVGPLAWYTVTVLGQSNTFVRTDTGAYRLIEGQGGTLVLAGGIYTFTAPDGTIATFEDGVTWLWPNDAGEAAPLAIVRPDGVRIDYHRKSVSSGGATYHRPQSITTNAGYQLHFEYQSNSFGAAFRYIAAVTALNNAVDACAPTANACSYSRAWPRLTFSGDDVTDALNRTTRIGTAVNQVTGVARPTRTSGWSQTVAWTTLDQVQTVSDGVGTWTYDFEQPGPTTPPYTLTHTVTDPLSHETAVEVSVIEPETPGGQTRSRVTQVTDPLGNDQSFTYDEQGRLFAAYAPEGNYTSYQYNADGNPTEVRHGPKPGSGLAVRTITATYGDCSTPIRCRRPTAITDARGNTTDLAYNAQGQVTSVTGPAPTTGATRPQTRTAYASRYAWYKQGGSSSISQAATAISVPVETSACTTSAACDGLAQEVLTTTAYQAGSSAAASNLLPVSVTMGSGDGLLAATTTTAWDPNGDPLTMDGPLAGTADVTRYIHDAMRQPVGVIGPDPDGAGARLFPATKTTYDADGQPTATARGTTTAQTDAAWAAFSALQTDATAYDARGLKTRDTAASGSANPQVVQYSYDAAGRLTCAARRMNPASLPADACALGTAGSFGPDRITHTTYDDADRPTERREGYATPDVRLERKQAWTPNGQVDWVEDGMGNRSDQVWDGFDRLDRLYFPLPTVGSHAANTADYEAYTYDANDNPVTKRTRAGDPFTFTTTFDPLNRITLVDAPSGTPDTSFTYDLLDRRLTASHAGGQTLSSTWDALGRELTQTGPLGAMSWQYDLAGRRTRMTWPDSVYVTYDWTLDDQMQRIRLSGTSDLIAYTYDNLGRRTLATRLNGMTTTSSYNTASQLTGLVNNLSGTTHDLTYGFDYSPAPQITQRTVSNSLYAYTPTDGTQAYVNNGRNQTTSAGGATVTWDAKANLTSDGVKSYTYDALNRMLTGGGSTLTYDPLDRLYSMTGTGAGRFQYDGSQLATVYDPATLTVTERYVAGPNPDEWVVIYSGSGTTSPSYPLQDAQGSVVALTNASAVATSILAYDEYGVPKTGNVGRMQYTGQMWLPDPGLYHYKARGYLPQLGRFVQTDPVGYEQGMNLYAYVRNDPVNVTDPTGRQSATPPASPCVPTDDNICMPDTVVTATQATEVIVTYPRPDPREETPFIYYNSGFPAVNTDLSPRQRCVAREWGAALSQSSETAANLSATFAAFGVVSQAIPGAGTAGGTTLFAAAGASAGVSLGTGAAGAYLSALGGDPRQAISIMADAGLGVGLGRLDWGGGNYLADWARGKIISYSIDLLPAPEGCYAYGL